MHSQIIVRTGKLAFSVSKKYKVTLNNVDERTLTYDNRKLTYELPIGQYTVVVEDDTTRQTKELIVGADQTKFVTVVQNMPYKVLRWFLIGMAVFATLFIVLNTASIPLMSIPFIALIPVIFGNKKRKNGQSFELTVSNL